MADVINLYAESSRNIIGDDSTPTLTLENTSSGDVLKLQNADGTGVALSIVSTPTTALYVAGADTGALITAPTAAQPLVVQHSTPGACTIAPLRLVASTASGAFVEFRGAFASAVSCTAQSRAVSVKIGDNYYWIPLYDTACYV